MIQTKTMRHIGQLFHKYDRTYEHQRFLDQLLNPLTKEQIDLFLISRDVFDVSDPSTVSIKMFSKPYVPQRIPNSLGLQGTDQDMGDEVRTVYSLSGGESFLVSLALALGLASLSSSRMKVESLFINEGFGSLDPATLNIAMDAQERLHNQGRKVGVISHVQEMTERIPMQIKVSKQQSGSSKVEVVGIINDD